MVTIAIANHIHTPLYIYNVLSLLWASLSVQQGQRYSRQTICYSSKAATDIQHCNLQCIFCTVGLTVSAKGQSYGRQTIDFYSNSSNSHTALYIYSVSSVLWDLLSVDLGQK